MNKEEILVKAMQEAIDNGWDPKVSIEKMAYETPSIIFSHDFAKALWGDGELFVDKRFTFTPGDYETSLSTKSWQYHLQKMVIAEEPIKYLGENNE